MSALITEVPTKLDRDGEFQLGKFTVSYTWGWDLVASCTTTVNDRDLCIRIPIAYSWDYISVKGSRQLRTTGGRWVRGISGVTVRHENQPLWDEEKPGKIRTAFKKELPTAVVMKTISHECESFLAAINPPETWLEHLFYARKLEHILRDAELHRRGFQNMVRNADQRIGMIQRVSQKPPAEKIAFLRKYDDLLNQSEFERLLDRDEKERYEAMVQEVGEANDPAQQLPIDAFMPQTLKEAHEEILLLRQRIRDKDV